MKPTHVPGRPRDLLRRQGQMATGGGHALAETGPLSTQRCDISKWLQCLSPSPGRESSHHSSVLARPSPVRTTLLLHHLQSTASHRIANPAATPSTTSPTPTAHHVCLPLPRRLRHEEAMALQHAQARRQLVHKRCRLPPARPQVRTARLFPRPCNNSIGPRLAHASPPSHLALSTWCWLRRADCLSPTLGTSQIMNRQPRYGAQSLQVQTLLTFGLLRTGPTT